MVVRNMDADCVEVIEVQSDFKSLTAKVDIPKGTFLGDFYGKGTPEKSRHTIHVELGIHVDCIGALRYTNHSCSPNAELIFHARNNVISEELSDRGQRLFWYLNADRDILKDEPITIDYNLIEYTTIEEFDCVCQSPNCLRRIRGFKFLSKEERDKRLPFASPVVLKLFENENNTL